MPSIDFSVIDEARSFEPIPEGQYRAEVSDVAESVTKSGGEMWTLAFRIIDGDHAGRLVYDRLIFTEKVMPRVKLVCSRLGLDVTGAVELAPAMLLNRTCLLTVEVGQYEDAAGVLKDTNQVPWGGYDTDSGPGATETADAGVF